MASKNLQVNYSEDDSSENLTNSNIYDEDAFEDLSSTMDFDKKSSEESIFKNLQSGDYEKVLPVNAQMNEDDIFQVLNFLQNGSDSAILELLPSPSERNCNVEQSNQVTIPSQTQETPMEEQSLNTNPGTDCIFNHETNSKQLETSQIKNSSKRMHLLNSRRKKGEKHELTHLVQSKGKGYFSKNFLHFGKPYHIQFLKRELGKEFYECEILVNLNEKNGMNLEDYQMIYSIPEFKSLWKRFFKSKYIYRKLMLAPRAQFDTKQIYLEILYRFQQAFQQGEFTHIA